MSSDAKGFAILCCMFFGVAAGMIAGWVGIACVSIAIAAIALAPHAKDD